MMKKTILSVIGFLTVLGVLAGVLAFTHTPVQAAGLDRYGPGGGSAQPGAAGRGWQTPQTGVTLTPLSAEEATGLVDAIQEEYGALTLYQSVLNSFGDVAPFNRIVRSEQQHLNSLLALAGKYNLEVPELTPPASLPQFGSLQEALQAAEQAEIADAALYDDFMAFTTHTDLLNVYSRLQATSFNSHLPAFQAYQ